MNVFCVCLNRRAMARTPNELGPNSKRGGVGVPLRNPQYMHMSVYRVGLYPSAAYIFVFLLL